MLLIYFLLQTLENVSKWVRDMKAESEELSEKIRFLSGFSVAFRDQIHTDILLQPGESGPPIPAHKALLVTLISLCGNVLSITYESFCMLWLTSFFKC